MDTDDLLQKKNLPHELQVEILSWLPINYLCPFRYVSKTWLHLISFDPQFAKLHLDRTIQSKTNPAIIVQRNKSQRYFHLATDHTTCDSAIPLELPFEQDGIGYAVYGICNGLLCLSCMGKDEVYIWNPITNDHITIKYPPTPSRFSGFKKGTRVAFGFHPSTNEYKIIKVFGECDYNALQFHSQVSVYTLGVDSSWRTVVEDMPYNISCCPPPCSLVNGVVHWLGMRTGSLSVCVIVAFDLKDEFFQEITPPDDVDFDHQLATTSIGELGGKLCIFCEHYQENLQIWVMKEYGAVNSWSKQFKIGLSEVGRFYDLSPLGVFAQDSDIILTKNKAELILYHPETNSISYLNDFGYKFYAAYTCTGSMISPKVISGARIS